MHRLRQVRAKACPSALPVDKLIAIRSAECTGCLECVAECPAAGVALIFVGVCGLARWTGYWHTELPSEMYFRLIPHANEFTHPR